MIKRLPAPTDGRHYALHFDDSCTGLAVRVTEAGSRSFVLSYRTTTGRHRRYTIGSCSDWTVGAARDHAKELKKRIRVEDFDPLAALHAGRTAPTVADLCERFAEEHLPKLRPSTQDGCKTYVENDVLPAMRHLKVADVTFADVDGLHRRITKRAPYAANRVHALLSKMFSLAVRWGWRSDNPCRGVEKNPESKRQRYLANGELTRLTDALARMEDQQAANIVRLLLLTGARSHEVLGMRWSQINFETSTWTKPSSLTKQKTEHTVPLAPAVLQILAGVERSGEHVFPGAGKTGHRESIRKTWDKLMRDAGITGLRRHDLRHSFASILASSGASLPLIGQLLGHTQAATTHRYAHLLDESQRAAVERVAGVVEGGKAAEIKDLRRRRT
jgi:integrase